MGYYDGNGNDSLFSNRKAVGSISVNRVDKTKPKPGMTEVRAFVDCYLPTLHMKFTQEIKERASGRGSDYVYAHTHG